MTVALKDLWFEAIKTILTLLLLQLFLQTNGETTLTSNQQTLVFIAVVLSYS